MYDLSRCVVLITELYFSLEDLIAPLTANENDLQDEMRQRIINNYCREISFG